MARTHQARGPAWILHHEEQDQRDKEREDAETFRERGADERAAELAVSGRRVAQGAREEAAENRAHADGGGAHSDGGDAGADVLGCGGIHLKTP